MTDYVVTWKIDISADSPREAAEKALKIQRDPSSIATVFEVVSDAGELEMVDLEESFINHYEHCGIYWTLLDCDSFHNDRCPICNAEIEPVYCTDQMGEIVYSTNPKEA